MSSRFGAARTALHSTFSMRARCGSTFATTNMASGAGRRRSAKRLPDVLAREAPTAVYARWGFSMPTIAARATLRSRSSIAFPTLDWHAYEDAIYRRIPGAVDARLRMLDNAGFALARHPGSRRLDAHARKQVAARCYASQLRALATRPAHADVFAPEAYWAIAPTRTRA